jgi:hypothetical protein
MSTLVSSLSELIALLVQSFNLSAVLPSFAFVLMNYLFVRPMLRNTAFYAIFADLDKSVKTIVLATVIVGLAYLLTAINLLIIRWVEGYPLIDQFPVNRCYQRHLQRARQISNDIQNLTKEIERLKKDARKRSILEREPWLQQQEAVRVVRQALVGEQLFLYPVSEWRILPTRLGNVIAAAEDYPAQLFGIDAVLLWPYLVPTLVETGYSKFIEREKAIFDLLLNSMVLVAVLGLEIGYLDAFLTGFTWRLPLELALIGGGVGVLYYLTTHGAMGWGSTIRAAFILYRHKLREALGLVKPDSYDEERKLWKRISDFYRNPAEATTIGPDPKLFDYEVICKNDKESAEPRDKR